MKTRFASWVGMLALVLVMPLTLPTPARAAGTTNWRCNVRADQPQTRTLSGADLARPSIDRRVYDLDCTFTATAPGPSPVTLCVSAPEGENAGGPVRRLKRRGGNEMIAYRLTAQTGNVPGAVSFPTGELRDTLQPLYTVQVGGGDAGTDGSFRHQLALVTEFQGNPDRSLSEGDYSDTLTGLVISLHEGTDCGLLLWGPPADSLGAAANFTTALSAPAICSISVLKNLDFGTVTDLKTQLSVSANVSVLCPLRTVFRLGMGDGQNATSTTRRMARIGFPGDFIPYQILLPGGEQWNSTGSMLPGRIDSTIGVGTLQNRAPRGVIAAGTPLPGAGKYSDTVLAILDF